MNSFSDSYALLIKLQETESYNKRLSFIESNLDRFDNDFVRTLNAAVALAHSDSSLQSSLASFRAITLAEIVYVHGRLGNVAMAKRFATHCLKAYQDALYGGSRAGSDRAKETNNLLEALLVDAGEFRGYGLEEEAWQAYWIADPIMAAKDTIGDSVTAGQLLAAAVTLEQVGMLEGAEKNRQQALAKIGNAKLLQKEEAAAKKIVGPPPNELPPPDIYDGLTMESALRFRSQTVAVRCVKQTRCPKCRGPMSYQGSMSFVHKDGYYRQCELTCQTNQNHPGLVLFRNSLLLAGSQIFAGLGSQLDREEEERLKKASAALKSTTASAKKGRSSRSKTARSKENDRADPISVEPSPGTGVVQGDATKLLASYLMELSPEERAKTLEPYKEYFKPSWPKPRALFVMTSVFLIISVWISLVPALFCYLVFRWSGLPSPFLRVLLGCAAGLVIYHLFLLLARKSALQNFIRRTDLLSTADRSAKVSRARVVLVTLLSLAAGCVSAFLIGAWAGMAAMPLAALNLRFVLKRRNEKSARRDG